MRSIKIDRFCVDKNLGYMIQQETGESTNDILLYFYGMALYVAEDALKNSKASRLQKEVVLFYKESAMPFKIRVGSYQNLQNKETSVYSVSVIVDFPKKSRLMNVTDLLTSATEAGLGLIETPISLPKFEKPELKTPKCLKSIRIQQNAARE